MTTGFTFLQYVSTLYLLCTSALAVLLVSASSLSSSIAHLLPLPPSVFPALLPSLPPSVLLLRTTPCLSSPLPAATCCSCPCGQPALGARSRLAGHPVVLARLATPSGWGTFRDNLSTLHIHLHPGNSRPTPFEQSTPSPSEFPAALPSLSLLFGPYQHQHIHISRFASIGKDVLALRFPCVLCHRHSSRQA